MNQPELPFDAHKLARTENPETSKAAARSCRELRGEHHALILDALADGNANADELAPRCGLTRHQIGRRLGELENAGLVRKTGAARPSASGRMANCYEACDSPATA